MKILFLDDDSDRHALFMRGVIGHEVTQVWNAREAMVALAANPQFDLAYLDHDLGGAYEPDEDGQWGSDVAKFIAGMAPERQPKTIILHSLNAPGAMNMAAILRDGGHRRVARIPFTQMAALKVFLPIAS